MNYFITFGDKKFQNSIDRIEKQANDIGVFDNIIIYTDDWLKEQKEFWDVHKDFVENNPRGYGYWLWKAYITKKTLSFMNDNDILCYADAGCTINKHGVKRIMEYFDILNQSNYGTLSFELEHIEYRWTKKDLAIALGASDSILYSPSLIATSFLLRKCENSIKVVDEWYNYGCNYHLIDDTPSIEPNSEGFIENRHDQAIFSILRKLHGTVVLQNEVDISYYSPQMHLPIWGTRIRN